MWSSRTTTTTKTLHQRFWLVSVIIVTHSRTASCTSLFTTQTTTATTATYPTYDTALYDGFGIATAPPPPMSAAAGKDLIGQLVPLGRYPTFAATGTEQPFCSGVLIWPDIILTAAHCEGAFNVLNSYVTIGGTLRSTVNSNAKERINVKQCIKHPEFNRFDDYIRSDIMLVVLKSISNITVSPYNTNPVLPFENQTATVVGSGFYTARTGTCSYELTDANVTIVSVETCRQESDIKSPLCSNETFCGTSNMETTLECTEDSGGPVFDPPTGIVMGIISFGYRSPYGYTRVSTYESWIRDTICKYSAVVNRTTTTAGVCSLPPLQPPPTTMVSPAVVPTSPMALRVAPSSPIFPAPSAAAPIGVCGNREYPPPIIKYCDVYNGECAEDNFMHKRYLFFGCRKACIKESVVKRYLFFGWKCGPC